jgi:GNAT superfamily N-acetyltransferase
VIRHPRWDDYDAVREIERRAGERFRAIGMPEIADDEPYSEDELAAADLLLVATDDTGAAVGYAMAGLVDDHAHLEQLSVAPDQGGRGVGTALIDAVVDWARTRGDAEVTLTTFRDVPFNAPLYAKRGFAVLDEAQWTEDVRAVVAREAAHGLDVTQRVVMRRPVQ